MAGKYLNEDGPASYEEVERQSGGEIGYDPNYVPDSVKSFVVHMYRHIREKNVYEIHQMCETSFQSLSERLFKDTPWPSVEAIAPYVDNDHVFCLLYREMWFRHLYARLTPTLQQRIDSYDNYCSLFQLATYMEVDEPTLRTILLTYKHKTHSVDSEGRIISNADIDFYINNGMIYVVESKPAKRYGDFFLRQIAKLEGVINDMDRIKLE